MRSDIEASPFAAFPDPGGGLWLTGSDRGQLWLGRVASDGIWAASTQILLGPGGSGTGLSLSRDAKGQIAIAGVRPTDIIDFTEPLGVFLKSNSLEPGSWRANGMQARPTSNREVRLIDERALIAAGRLEYADKKRGAFVAKVDYRGSKIWAIDQTGWDLTSVYDIELDADGAIYAIGGIRSSIHPDSERAVMVKVGADGTLIWKRDLEPAGSGGRGYSRSTQLAISLDQKHLWAVGQTGSLSGPLVPRAWRVSASDGMVVSTLELEASGVFEGGVQSDFADLLVRQDGIYYAWNARSQVGEDLLGFTTRVARMNERGESTWKLEYTTNRGPGAVPHVFVRALKEGAAGGIYVVGQRLKVSVPEASPVGESYGYVGRFCPPS